MEEVEVAIERSEIAEGLREQRIEPCACPPTLFTVYAARVASKFPCVAYASPTTRFAVARPGKRAPILSASRVTNSYPPKIFPAPICATRFSSQLSSSPMKSHLPRGLV